MSRFRQMAVISPSQRILDCGGMRLPQCSLSHYGKPKGGWSLLSPFPPTDNGLPLEMQMASLKCWIHKASNVL